MKEGEWIKVPNAEELAGRGFKNNYPMQIDEITDKGVMAGGCEWFHEEYTKCSSPLFYQKDKYIMNSEGKVSCTVEKDYLRLIPIILEQLNEEYY